MFAADIYRHFLWMLDNFSFLQSRAVDHGWSIWYNQGLAWCLSGASALDVPLNITFWCMEDLGELIVFFILLLCATCTRSWCYPASGYSVQQHKQHPDAVRVRSWVWQHAEQNMSPAARRVNLISIVSGLQTEIFFCTWSGVWINFEIWSVVLIDYGVWI